MNLAKNRALNLVITKLDEIYEKIQKDDMTNQKNDIIELIQKFGNYKRIRKNPQVEYVQKEKK